VGTEAPIPEMGNWGVGSIKAVLRMGVNVFEAVEVHAESGLAAGTAGVYVPVRAGDKEVGGRGFHGFFAGREG